MAHHGPDLLAHIREHEMLMEKLEDLNHRFEESQDSMALMLTTFMGMAAPPYQRRGFQLCAVHETGQVRRAHRICRWSVGPGAITFL